ncbi:OmpA family protein [Spirosoma flavum]|uniref:OmpA family protein n=1 Tax=Spirosoma flavum TaxID=2048557 RepID=A0ABW6AFS7_9BACT
MNKWLLLRYIGLAILATAWHGLFDDVFISHSDLDVCSITTETWDRKLPTIVPLSRADSGRKTKPSVLTIKAFAGEISKPLPSAVVVIRSRATGKTEQFALPNGQLERTFTSPDEVFMEVSAAGYSSVKRNMTIALSPQGNRYEFDAELDRTGINLTIWAVDRQTDKIIPDARFTLSGKAAGITSVTLTPDATTGLSKIHLPAKGTYLLSSTAEGYANFAKSIKLDSIQNEARFILAKHPPAETKPPSRTAAVAASEVPKVKPVVPTAPTAPITTNAASVSTVTAKPFKQIEKGKPIQLSNIYFDQSSPVLRPQSYPELDQLYEVLVENPSVQIEIRGHTDNQGDFDLNTKLSRDRCQSIIDYLAGKGIVKSRLKAVGRGPIDPVAPNNNEENRKKNRRVEFVVL